MWGTRTFSELSCVLGGACIDKGPVDDKKEDLEKAQHPMISPGDVQINFI